MKLAVFIVWFFFEFHEWLNEPRGLNPNNLRRVQRAPAPACQRALAPACPARSCPCLPSALLLRLASVLLLLLASVLLFLLANVLLLLLSSVLLLLLANVLLLLFASVLLLIYPNLRSSRIHYNLLRSVVNWCSWSEDVRPVQSVFSAAFSSHFVNPQSIMVRVFGSYGSGSSPTHICK